jgi:predicted chitinase
MLLKYKEFSKLYESITPGSASEFLELIKKRRNELEVKKINPSDVITPLPQKKEKGLLQTMWDMLMDKGEAEDLDLDPKVTPVAGTLDMTRVSSGDKKMAEIVLEKLKKYGIVNPIVQKAILSVVGKESKFNPQISEVSYSKTLNSRIRKIFGNRVKDLSDSELNSLKKDQVKFWDRVYGESDPTGASQKMGNTEPGDGYKYRGRGFNGITFKSNYKKYTDLLRKNGVNANLVQNPELLTDPEIAAEVNALYFVEQLSSPESRKKYGNGNPNDFKDFQTALKAVTNANAGWGRNIEGSEDLAKATEYSKKIDVQNLTNLA